MSLKVLVVGATGTIGVPVAAVLEERGHEIVRVGRSSGDVTVDLSNPKSIRVMYEGTGAVDALVCTAGLAGFGAVDALDDDAFELSIRNKMMGQINLVRAGLAFVADAGSFTLTTGTLSQRPTTGSAAVAMAGGAVESFVRAAALDLSGRQRLNAVSPGWVAESRVAAGLDPMPGIWALDLAAYYVACVEGEQTGQVLEAERPLGID